jgi:hypothetical protein
MKKIIGQIIIALALFVGLGYLGFSWIKYENRPIVYLIPEGTKGWGHIVYEDPNASSPVETKSERIIRSFRIDLFSCILYHRSII